MRSFIERDASRWLCSAPNIAAEAGQELTLDPLPRRDRATAANERLGPKINGRYTGEAHPTLQLLPQYGECQAVTIRRRLSRVNGPQISRSKMRIRIADRI